MSIYPHVACCLDDSVAARLGLAEAGRLRDAGASMRLSVVHVVPPPPMRDVIVGGISAAFGGAPLQEDYAVEHEEARLWLETATEHVPGVETVLLVSGGDDSPAGEVCKWAAEHGVDLLVAAAHRGVLERLGVQIGSFSAHLAHHAPCPVLLVRPEPSPQSVPEV